MKTLLVNTYDSGGAAASCIRLHIGLLNIGIDSKLQLLNQSKVIPSTFSSEKLYSKQSILKKLKSNFLNLAVQTKIYKPNFYSERYQNDFLKNRLSSLEWFSYPFSPYDLTQISFYKELDIINLHWVSGLLDWPSFFLKNTKPLVWTLHDENPFRGGEHFSERFLGIDFSGNPIKREYTEMEILEQSRILNIKREILSSIPSRQLHIVAPSKWLLETSKASELFSRFDHSLISYGFDTNIFKQYQQKEVRKKFNLPEEKIILLFVADNLTNERKGFKYLKKAFEQLKNDLKKNVLLCSIGKSYMNTNENTINFGHISDQNKMAMLYSAVDAFVIPSLEDNLPNTMIESLLCGTPVIGFPTGGIRETIVPDFNGYLSNEISVNELKDSIEKFIIHRKSFKRDEISYAAKQKYSLIGQALSYKTLFEEIIEKNK